MKERGSLKVELILTLVSVIGVPVGSGIWIGALQNRVSHTEERLKEVESTPVNIAVLQSEMSSVKEEVKGAREDIKTLTKEVREATR